MPKKYVNYGDRQASGLRLDENGYHTMQADGDEKKGYRRVSFNSISKQKRRGKYPGLERSFEDDVNMNNGASYENGRNYYRGHGGNLSRSGHEHRPQNSRFTRNYHNSEEFSWHQVTILSANNYSKDYIIDQLQKFLAPNTFVPIAYKIVRNDAEFYVDNAEDARNLFSCNRKIVMPDEQKLLIRTRPHYPHVTLDDALKLKMKCALNKRYSSENNALDLSRFHHDPDLVSDHFCALFKSSFLEAVLDMVAEYLPNLVALSLSSNRLNNLETLSILKTKLKNLKILHLSDNKIQMFPALDSLKDMQLEELKIDKNPLADKFKNRRADYIR